MSKNQFKILGVIGGAGLLLGSFLPVFAETTFDANARVEASVKTRPLNAEVKTQSKMEVSTERITRGKSRADEEIARRIKALTELKVRIGGMVRVSAAIKAAIASQVDSEINNLTSLKAKIAADTELAALKADIQSITKSYRIFALIIPEGHIAVTADKIKTTADMIAALGVKLGARIAAAKTAGKDVSISEAALADLNLKVADAKVQADAAISIIKTLVPDNGDEAKFQANKKALTDARAKLRVGETDLKAANKDARLISQSLKQEMKVRGEERASTTPKFKDKEKDKEEGAASSTKKQD